MASILKGRLALALIMLIVASSTLDTISLADARTSYKGARQLANNCEDGPGQSDLPGCGGGGGDHGSRRPGPGVSTPGSSLCKKGCCGRNIKGGCKCCK
ncbi:hypothetical protein HanRHA438_Chr13g0578241 [Helianthus annuus]|uniref:Uncharacterized protein n=1 Tax=Helianthus annuus TaxID=4232 RepID=A0A251SMU7_HELAN|nr:hypothetical protein HanXRQr2_Chr13g0566491 [Helianthus annuus]KAJ0479190.1 hypothetical protein HanIR_Chr13g0617261 [Helianthus annuus]KAJ0847452.1 hypothetical protein HanPSC8_Chr13g0545501 [Helianthus annuus]KAJ0856415.1 hypothetical protein HanRHA438_Chr13g0578241 [Helianthus annuus]